MDLIAVPRLGKQIEDDRRLVGREGQVERIAGLLAAGSSAALVPSERLVPDTSDAGGTVSMHGMGGVGKTALAIEFCRSASAAIYDLIWWIDAETSTSVSQSYTRYREHFELTIPEGVDTESFLDNDLCQRQGRSLLVYDNVENRQSLNELVPTNYAGDILVTSRDSSGWDSAGLLRVDTLEHEPSTLWLLFAARVADSLDDDLEQLRKKHPEDVDHAEWLAGNEAIGGLALALTMATNYLSTSGCGLAKYRTYYESDVQAMLDSNEKVLPDDYTRTVFITFAVSLDKLVREDEAAAKMLLEIASFYAPDNIPKWIFNPETLESEQVDAVDSALITLALLALVTLDKDPETGADKDSFSIHRVIQEVTRYYLRVGLPDIEAIEAERSGNVVKWLLVSALPKEETHIDVEGATAAVQRTLTSSRLTDRIEVKHLPGATLEDLNEALRTDNPDVVCFTTHASKDQGLHLRDHHNLEDSRWVAPETLQGVFEGSNVRLVQLAGCHTDNIAEALNSVVPTVIGTTDFLEDGDAVRYLTEATKTIAGGHPLNRAHRDALAVVNLKEGHGVFLNLTAAEDVTLFS